MRGNTNISQVELYLPKIELKKKLKKVIITGRSLMSDPGEYYNEFANTLSDYFIEFNHTLFIEFYFDYINTGSSKWLLFVMQYLNSVLKEKGGMIEVTWKYDDDDETILETGEVLRSYINVPFTLMAV
jgi:hypothetical protein